MMSSGLRRRVRLVLGRDPETEIVAAHDAAPPARVSQIEFVAYAEDCVLSGFIALAEDRLTDLLNAHEEYELVDVYAEDLATGTASRVDRIVVQRDELMMVHATGPRGDRGRRQHTRQHPLALQVGPYHVRGYLHALPGTDPVSSFAHRRPMVPLTEAWVEYRQGEAQQRQRVSTLVVNRHLADWVAAAHETEVEMPELYVPAARGPLFKDFTAYVLDGPSPRNG